MGGPEVVYSVGDHVRVYSPITRSLIGEAVLIEQHINARVFLVREEWSGKTNWVSVNRMQPASRSDAEAARAGG